QLRSRPASSDLPAVDLGRHQGGPAAAGGRDGNDHLRGRGAARHHQRAAVPPPGGMTRRQMAAGSQPAGALVATALAGARPVPYWLDQPGAPGPASPLAGPAAASLAAVGGGVTRPWA